MLTQVVCQHCQARVEVNAEEDNPSCPGCSYRVRHSAVPPIPSPPAKPGVAPDPRVIATARLEALRAATAYWNTRHAVGWVALVGFLGSGLVGLLGLWDGDLLLITLSVCLGVGVIAVVLLSLVLVDIADALIRRS